MSKVKVNPQPVLYPTPAVLVGTVVDGLPNFMTAAWCGVANSIPPMVTVAVRHQRHTLKGINQNNTFSVNVPSASQVKETDYCGVVSGAKADKAKICGFKLFYGKLESAPMIEQCPVNLECKVSQTLNLGSHMLVIGSIEDVHVSEDCLTEGRPDVAKINPFAYVMGTKLEYRLIGDSLGTAFSIGQELNK